MKHESPPIHIDVKALAQTQSAISGHDLLSKYERLMDESRGLGADRLLNWQARGELRGDEAGTQQVWLHLVLDLSLPLTCQRCLGPVDIAVAVDRSFRFVDSEEAAAEQDPEAPEDVLVISSEFKLLDLIEDEVLMALPVVARHDTCPVEVRLTVADPGFEAAAAEKRNPFAVLAELKKPKPD